MTGFFILLLSKFDLKKLLMNAIKLITGVFIVALLMLSGISAWMVFGSSTNFPEDKKSLFIKTGSSFNEVSKNLQEEGFINSQTFYKWVSVILKFKSVKPGKYVFEKKSSLVSIIRTLKQGKQTPVNLVINKLRLKEDLARKIAANFECDSLSFISILNNNDSLKAYGLDTNTVMTAVIPNTYSLVWTTPAIKIFRKLYYEQEKFWNRERKQKAKALNLTTGQVYTLASIVEEETNMEDDKGKIASVYLNRMNKGMKLAADPTVKFAMKDFAIKRIYNKHLEFPSPYNTYQQTGLPPGPICTPSFKTIDAVLNAPSTNYLFFVAKPDFKGYSNFAANYEEHLQYAKAYQQALDELMQTKAVK